MLFFLGSVFDSLSLHEQVFCLLAPQDINVKSLLGTKIDGAIEAFLWPHTGCWRNKVSIAGELQSSMSNYRELQLVSVLRWCSRQVTKAKVAHAFSSDT